MNAQGIYRQAYVRDKDRITEAGQIEAATVTANFPVQIPTHKLTTPTRQQQLSHQSLQSWNHSQIDYFYLKKYEIVYIKNLCHTKLISFVYEF